MELTMGDKRFISESADGWKMAVYSKNGPDVSDSLRAKINDMAADYVSSFEEYFVSEAEKNDMIDTDELQQAFDVIYKEKHPEFFDIDALIKEV